jgi:hypothetical protein
VAAANAETVVRTREGTAVRGTISMSPSIGPITIFSTLPCKEEQFLPIPATSGDWDATYLEVTGGVTMPEAVRDRPLIRPQGGRRAHNWIRHRSLTTTDQSDSIDRRRQTKAIHFGHLDIQERDIVRFAFSDGSSQLVKGFMTAGGAAHLHLPCPNLVTQDLTVRVVIVDHQHPHVQPVKG